jgi:hypothetical protein
MAHGPILFWMEYCLGVEMLVIGIPFMLFYWCIYSLNGAKPLGNGCFLQ